MPIARLGGALRSTVGGLPSAYWWLWASTLVNRLGSFVATFMALYLTVHRGYPASYAGLVVSLYSAGGVVASPIAGVAADRFGRRPVLLVAQVSTAVAVLALGLAERPFPIAMAAFLVGVTSNLSRPAVQAMMADIVRPEDRVRAFSLNYWAVNLGFAVSAVAAGFMVEHSYFAGFLVEALMTLTCAAIVFLKIPESRPAYEAVPVEEVREGLGSVFRHGQFMVLVVLSFIIALVFQQGFIGLPLAMASRGFDGADYGMAVAVNGMLIVAMQVPVTRLIQHRDPRWLLVVSSLLAGVGFGLTGFAGSTFAFGLTVALWTLAEIVNAPTQSSLVVRLSPVRSRGRYQGVYSSAWAASGLVAPLVGGVVLDEFGEGWLWALCAALGALAALGYWLLLRDVPVDEPVTERVPEPSGVS